jgi:YihY family inner membrane protein
MGEILSAYDSKEGPTLAKGIAYSFLITCIPLLFIAFYISTIIFSGAEELQQIYRSRLGEIIPQQVAEYLVNYLYGMILDKNWIKIGAIGMIGLLFIPRGLFACLEGSLVTVMESPRRRPVFKRQLLYFALIFLAICLFFIASSLFMVIKALFAFTKVPSIYYYLGSKIISVFLICITLIVIYRICYHSSLKFPILFGVSFSVALIWQIINYIGASIITVSGKNEIVYGILASGIVFLIWAYIFAVLILLGGIIIARHSK